LLAHGKPTTGGDMTDPRLEGTITIRLRIRNLPPSGLTDLGYDADWLLKDLHKLPYTDKKGKKSKPIPDKGHDIIECGATVRPEAPGAA
jgi:hypothetical protein